jgi:hypothetical protein
VTGNFEDIRKRRINPTEGSKSNGSVQHNSRGKSSTDPGMDRVVLSRGTVDETSGCKERSIQDEMAIIVASLCV